MAHPYKAVHEVLVNAVMHRDYQKHGTEIHVDMFDDRMEIVSPGGMISGNRIQDLDLRHVTSMRRNEIISDIFGRLHYMDRRGSGIGKIMNSYAAFVEKPGFFSNDTCFAVILPNRSVAEHAQITLKSQENYWELQFFKEVVLPKAQLTFRRKTKEGLIELFESYRYRYEFNRRNVSDIDGCFGKQSFQHH